MRKRFPLYIGLALLLILLLMAFFPGLFTHWLPKDMDKAWLPPGGGHLLGTNGLGYDLWAELVYGAGETLLVGLLSSVLAMALGAVIGMLSAGKGIVSAVLNGLIQIFVLLPRLITLIVLAAFFGSGSRSLILLIALFSWSGTARVVRAQVQQLRSQPFLESCRVQGLGPGRILFCHLLPNLYELLLSRFLLGVNSCVLMESTLSFLGFGDLYHPTWGTIINLSWKRGALLRSAWAGLLAPGLCIMLLSLAFYLISIYIQGRRETVG